MASRNPPYELIERMPTTRTAYMGRSSDGKLSFARGQPKKLGAGWYMRNKSSTHKYELGPWATLAMGITERCVYHGRGMVFFIESGTRSGTVAEAPKVIQQVHLQTLVYIDYKWSVEEQEQWFRMRHVYRYKLLHARANTINTHTVCMPIGLTYDQNPQKDHVRFYDRVGQVFMFYDPNGNMYLGFKSDLLAVPGMQGWGIIQKRTQVTAATWQAPTTSFDAFRVRDGNDLPLRLRNMFLQNKRLTLCSWLSLEQKILDMHDAWVRNGGYTMASDPALRDVEAKVQEQERLWRARQQAQVQGGATAAAAPAAPATDPATRFREIFTLTGSWSTGEQILFQAFIDMFNQGPDDVMAFMINDEDWQTLSKRKQQLCLEYCQNVAKADAAEDNGDNDDDEDDEDGAGAQHDVEAQEYELQLERERQDRIRALPKMSRLTKELVEAYRQGQYGDEHEEKRLKTRLRSYLSKVFLHPIYREDIDENGDVVPAIADAKIALMREMYEATDLMGPFDEALIRKDLHKAIVPDSDESDPGVGEDEEYQAAEAEGSDVSMGDL